MNGILQRKGRIKWNCSKPESGCGVLLSFCLIGIFKSGHPVKALLLSAGSGVATLFAVSLLQQSAGPLLPVNEVTLGVSAVGGVPGVILLLCARLILG